MLVKKVYFNDFLDEFKKYNRDDQFSYEGKKALYNYLNDLGELIELDVIGLCCDFSEYSSLKEFNNDYSYSIGENIDFINDVYDYTIVIPIDDKSFIIQDF